MKKKTRFCAGRRPDCGARGGRTGHFSSARRKPPPSSDPRQEPPFVRLTVAAQVTGSERGFTGVIGARVQSNLGFRVPGKIVERLVDVGDQVKAGQPLMRIDDTDLRLALTAKRNAVAAARASFVQLDADERRYAKLVSDGWVSRQRYDQAKAASDTAEAQLAAAEAERRSPKMRRLIPSWWRTRMERWLKPLASRDRSSPPARPWFGLPKPAPAKRWSHSPKPFGRRLDLWLKRVCMGAMDTAIRHISGSYLTLCRCADPHL